MKTPATILIVDDLAANRETLVELLDPNLYHLVEAADGSTALRLAAQTPPDLVLLDVMMPEMDGYEVCRRLRADARLAEVPILMITALDDQASLLAGLEAGADDFITKPFHRVELRARVRSITRLNRYRRIAEAQERIRSQARWLDEARDAIVVRDLEDRITYWNDGATRLFGWTREEAQGRTAAELLHHGKTPFNPAPFLAARDAGDWQGEMRKGTKAGREIIVGSLLTLLRNSRGAPSGILSIDTDITEKKRAEEAMRESEERFRQLAENIQSVFWLIDPAKSQMLYISPAYEPIWGRTCESLYRNPGGWAEAIHPGDRRRVLEAARTRQRSGRYDESYRIVRPDGSQRWIRDRAFPVRDKAGQVYRIAGTAQDITDRKGAEQRTEVQHLVTAVLAEIASFPETTKKILEIICRRLEWDMGDFWTLDRAAKVLRCVELWHPPSTEFLEFADATRSLVLLPEEGLPGQAWASGEPFWIPDVLQSPGFSRRAVAGKLGLHGVLVFPVKLRNEVLGVMEFFRARVLPPDAELLTLFSALGTQVGQFIERKQLEEQFRQAQKMEAIGQLAGGVAHDFNNLLTVIQGHTQLLQTAERLDPGMAEDLQQVFLASERAARLASQLLAFSRKHVVQSRLVDLNEIVEGVSKMLQRIIGEDVTLRIDPGLSLPVIKADSGMMEQVLMNLAVNARDDMHKGGTLMVGTSRAVLGEDGARLHPNARMGEFVCLRVADTGCGMTPETAARIFEPFFTTKAFGKGTGLGLATVHGIVQQHQGWVEVESQPGEGTVFKAYFPAAGPSAKTTVKVPVSSAARGGSETILLVEDEPAIRDLARIILERQGYRVLEAGSGVAALAVWDEHAKEISLVITDMVMPDGMTGRELAEQLTARSPSLRVIYSTGYSAEAMDQELNLEIGLNYLPKPYDPRALAQIVRKRLDA
jgi:two-component system cell cycle sensor histidine kinase/response regulator CckA